MQTLHPFRNLSADLAAIQQKMEGHARDYGLDFFPTVFELVSAEPTTSGRVILTYRLGALTAQTAEQARDADVRSG